MISRDIKRVIISEATSSIGIALCEQCVPFFLAIF